MIENNPVNVVNLVCELDKQDKLFEFKQELLSTKETEFRYLLKGNFDTYDAFSILYFLRFVVYKGDKKYLQLVK